MCLHLSTSNTKIWFYQMKSKETKMDNNDSFSYETKKGKKRHSPSQTVLPLLATTSGAVEDEWEKEEWETANECEYNQ